MTPIFKHRIFVRGMNSQNIPYSMTLLFGHPEAQAILSGDKEIIRQIAKSFLFESNKIEEIRESSESKGEQNKHNLDGKNPRVEISGMVGWPYVVSLAMNGEYLDRLEEGDYESHEILQERLINMITHLKNKFPSRLNNPEFKSANQTPTVLEFEVVTVKQPEAASVEPAPAPAPKRVRKPKSTPEAVTADQPAPEAKKPVARKRKSTANPANEADFAPPITELEPVGV